MIDRRIRADPVDRDGAPAVRRGHDNVLIQHGHDTRRDRDPLARGIADGIDILAQRQGVGIGASDRLAAVFLQKRTIFDADDGEVLRLYAADIFRFDRRRARIAVEIDADRIADAVLFRGIDDMVIGDDDGIPLCFIQRPDDPGPCGAVRLDRDDAVCHSACSGRGDR